MSRKKSAYPTAMDINAFDMFILLGQKTTGLKLVCLPKLFA
jgi:hypothetical protein